MGSPPDQPDDERGDRAAGWVPQDDPDWSSPVLGARASGVRRIVGGPWGRVAEKWVPEPLREARVDPGRRGTVVLMVVAAVAAIAAAVGVWSSRPTAQPVSPVASAPSVAAATGSTAPPPAPSRSVSPGVGTAAWPTATGPTIGGPSAATAAATSTHADIFVSVTGKVERPGLVRLAAGSRVADAIAAAGGVGADGDVTGLNLAQRLADGDSVVVGSAAAAPAIGVVVSGQVGASTGGGGTDPVRTAPAAPAMNLNTADALALEALPGVGPVMAGNIVAWREANGAFTSVEQLQEVSGIGPARFAQLAPLVTV